MITLRTILSCFVVSMVLLGGPLLLQAHEGHRADDAKGPSDISDFGKKPVLRTIPVDVREQLGKKIRGDVVFLDESGNRIKLSEYIDRPTLLLPIFYGCTQSCGIMLGNLAIALNDVPMEPGKDFRVIALSFDDQDGPGIAMQAKRNYLPMITRKLPPDSWKFLTGDDRNIRGFTDSVGFSFQRLGPHDFVHPNTLIVISRDGTVIRYLYGPTFLPFDIGMALTEAVRGTPSISVRKLVSYCFSYDPQARTYSFSAIRFIVAGILGLIGLFLYLIIRKKESRHQR